MPGGSRRKTEEQGPTLEILFKQLGAHTRGAQVILEAGYKKEGARHKYQVPIAAAPNLGVHEDPARFACKLKWCGQSSFLHSTAFILEMVCD